MHSKNMLEAKQNYLVAVQQKLDSLKIVLPKYDEAVNAQINLTPELDTKSNVVPELQTD